MSNVTAAASPPTTTSNTDASPRIWSAMALAIAAGAASLVSPALALAALTFLSVRALTRSTAVRIDLAACLGPAIAALVVGAFVGLAGAIGVIFVWRIMADCRWSLRAAHPSVSAPLMQLHAWLTPLFGIAIVAYTAPHMVAGLPLDLPHVPLLVPVVVGVLALLSFLDWGLRRAVDWRLGELDRAPAEHMLAHHIIFLLALGIGIDVSAGIVALIAWRLAHAGQRPQASLTAVP